MLAAGRGLEAVLAQALQGRGVIGDDDGEVGAGRHHRALLVHQVDLGPLALQPGEPRSQRRWRLDPLEAEQGEELDGAVEVGGGDFDADVVEHQNASDTRAAATTIAVDQTTASATIWLSRP